MRIAVIGAGSVGATLGQAWLRHGEDVTWGLRNPLDPKYAALPKGRIKPPVEAARDADVVVIATPWPATEAAVKGLGGLANKVVIVDRHPIRTHHRRVHAKSSGATLRCAPPALALCRHNLEGGQLFDADPGQSFGAV